MARILATMVLLVLYQETQTQRKINWGRRLCEQVGQFSIIVNGKP